MAVASEEKNHPVASPTKAKQGRPPKNTEKLFQKKPLGVNQTTNKKVVCCNPGESKGLKRKRAKLEDLDDDEVKSAVMNRAMEIQANLAPEFPSMIKYMLRSHVTGGFWLGLPKAFCIKHLPKQDTTIFLEDESGKEYVTKFLLEKVGLSGGWRGFSIAHKLLEGDVLVFHLVRPSKFKVYIVRRNGSDEVDGALGLLKLDPCSKQTEYVNPAEKDVKICEKVDNECLELFILDIPQENTKKDSLMVYSTTFGPIYQSENESDGSEVLDGGIKLSDSVVEFKEVKSIEDFTILVNGLIINAQLSKHLQTKYYELCCSQKSFLHDHLFEGLNCGLVAGMIAETINIADAIRASKRTTSQDNFILWDKTLKAFEDLGMNVGFLRARLDQLLNLLVKSKRYTEARIERTLAEEEMTTLEAKLLEVKETMNRLDTEIENMEANTELMFKEVANTPW